MIEREWHYFDNLRLSLCKDDKIVLKETVELEEDRVAVVVVVVGLGKMRSGIRFVPELVVVCCDEDENGGWLQWSTSSCSCPMLRACKPLGMACEAWGWSGRWVRWRNRERGGFEFPEEEPKILFPEVMVKTERVCRFACLIGWRMLLSCPWVRIGLLFGSSVCREQSSSDRRNKKFWHTYRKNWRYGD